EDWSSRCGITVSNYTVAPYFSFEGGIGGHEWLIELKDPSVDHESLERSLDLCMREVNSDYDTKREGEINMMPLKITWIKNDAFSRWMKKNGKFGGQHKIPRIQNDRNLLEEILRFER
ncbi:MAG: GH3 auxin-responsive promoter family protein, partial [Flavobacteriales bacterium]